MFTVYNIDGVLFKETLNELYNVLPISKSNQVENKLESFPEYAYMFKQEESPKKSKITKKATETYKKIANLHSDQVIYHVNQIMTRSVITISIDATLQNALDLIEDNKVKQLPVLNTDGIISGIISSVDILRALGGDPAYAQEILNRRVKDIMSDYIITTDPISDVRRVSKVMTDYSLNSIPIVDKYNNIVGIVSKSDIVKAISNEPHFQMWY